MTAPEVLRVGNCSGFFGDRAHAAREMVEGGPLDVLTGDWLAELTMYILHKTRERTGGYARTFLRELEEVLPTCIERGITVVSNAGGLHPEALAAAVGELARRQGLDVHVASVSGDDITPDIALLQAQGEKFVNLDTGEVLPADAPLVTANAYLRARPIADALAAGAQVVVTGRVTDAALVVGPALHAFGWSDTDLDAIAGAVVAGHVIECGAQCCGGNYAFFEEVPDRARIGFPLAEVRADGSSVITKHPGTGGMVTVGTVTAQLLYEIGSPRYLSPDAVPRFDSIALSQEGPDRVRIGPVRGEAPPTTLKVTANLHAGWRNAMTLALTGAQPAEKARFAAETVWAGIPGGRDGFAETAEDLSGDLTGGGMAYLRLAVRGDDEQAVGRAFSGAVVETSLSSYPGTFFTSAPSGAQGVARYWPTTVGAGVVTPRITCDGRAIPATPPERVEAVEPVAVRGTDEARAPEPSDAPTGHTVVVPLWVLVGARSGDKGGDANVGIWADDDAVAAWLQDRLTTALLKELLPEVEPYPVSRYPLPNLRAVNFVVHGILGWGVASNLRLDTQAKGLGELLRSRAVEVPAALVAGGPAASRLAAR
jgi:Acyclic terpene utilisation family protein AtuA